MVVIFSWCLDPYFLIQLIPNKKIETIDIQSRSGLNEQKIWDESILFLDMDYATI
jgi:hypothetical protein